jgi:hypothetical protein
MAKPDDAGRVIAGLLTYNPGPGIYSRLERAIQAMPENVRTQELPGLLKRYKDGVPGWELKAVDLDSVIGQRPAVSREELLQAVKERSPVYTHKEVVLGGNPPKITEEPSYESPDSYSLERKSFPVHEDNPSALGSGAVHGQPQYQKYGQGGDDYTEVLLLQPNAGERDFSNHWSGKGRDAVAHARFDVHDGFLRVNELQSDLGIHNRKVREAIASHKGPPQQLPSESDSAYLDRAQEQGYVLQIGDDGEWTWVNDPKKQGIPYPLEDSSLEILLKRLNLYAAQNGLRGVEIASPRAIADKVGGNIENYEHHYGKVVAGQQDRLGRKMGGMQRVTPVAEDAATSPYDIARSQITRERQALRDAVSRILGTPVDVGGHGWRRFADMEYAFNPSAYDNTLSDLGGRVMASGSEPIPNVQGAAERMYATLVRSGGLTPEQAGKAVGEALYRAQNVSDVRSSFQNVPPQSRSLSADGVIYRGIMSDEMRRRLIEGGVGAAVATGILSQDDLINRLNQ